MLEYDTTYAIKLDLDGVNAFCPITSRPIITRRVSQCSSQVLLDTASR